jgi:fluoride exporter
VPLLLVTLGGALGTLLRYQTNVWLALWLGPTLPYGTFVVNVLGSFLIGVLSVLGVGHAWLGVELRLILGTGVLGGFTTYSSFNLETLRMAQQGELSRAFGYVTLTVLSCLSAGALGLWVSQRLVR